jgi:N-acetylglutamate synthase-like GNAT family acetyltransferase
MEVAMPTEFAVRLASQADAPAVSHLLQASYPALMADSYEPEVLKVALTRMTNAKPVLLDSGTFYVAHTNSDQVIGCGGWSLDRPGSSETIRHLGHIRHFATHPNWLRHGVGRQIFSRIETQAALAEVREFQCFSSLNAIPFYAALGFSVQCHTQVAMGADFNFPVALMRRSINCNTGL